MSFSSDVKEELSRQLSAARHCRLAELSAILSCEGQLLGTGTGRYIKLQTENLDVARKYFTLIRKTFNINNDISVKTNINLNKNSIYTLMIRDAEAVTRILQATKLTLPEARDKHHNLGPPDNLVVQNACCKRAFIRGAFLSSGSMSDPRKSYHLEIVTESAGKADQLKSMIQAFSIDAKIVMRKRNYVVYIKEGSQIVDLLNVMEAHVALMNLENVRILKEMRNSINRQVNCEAANITKTVTASSRQTEDILYIRDHMGFGELDDGLEDIARLRIEYPEASLKELGAMLEPSIGKSGVNHRLRKLSMIAEQLREFKEENSYDNEGNCN